MTTKVLTLNNTHLLSQNSIVQKSKMVLTGLVKMLTRLYSSGGSSEQSFSLPCTLLRG